MLKRIFLWVWLCGSGFGYGSGQLSTEAAQAALREAQQVEQARLVSRAPTQDETRIAREIAEASRGPSERSTSERCYDCWQTLGQWCCDAFGVASETTSHLAQQTRLLKRHWKFLHEKNLLGDDSFNGLTKNPLLQDVATILVYLTAAYVAESLTPDWSQIENRLSAVILITMGSLRLYLYALQLGQTILLYAHVVPVTMQYAANIGQALDSISPNAPVTVCREQGCSTIKSYTASTVTTILYALMPALKLTLNSYAAGALSAILSFRMVADAVESGTPHLCQHKLNARICRNAPEIALLTAAMLPLPLSVQVLLTVPIAGAVRGEHLFVESKEASRLARGLYALLWSTREISTEVTNYLSFKLQQRTPQPSRLPNHAISALRQLIDLVGKAHGTTLVRRFLPKPLTDVQSLLADPVLGPLLTEAILTRVIGVVDRVLTNATGFTGALVRSALEIELIRGTINSRAQLPPVVLNWLRAVLNDCQSLEDISAIQTILKNVHNALYEGPSERVQTFEEAEEEVALAAVVTLDEEGEVEKEKED